MAAITRCFRHETLEAVLAALAEETGATQAWARQTLEALGRRCPFSLKVALRQLRAGTGDSPPNQALAVALEREYAVAEHIVARSDFRAGLHAALAGDTDPPAWRPSALSGVTPALIDAAFAPHDAPPLGLPPRQQSLVALG